MRFGIRRPSLGKRIAARTSIARAVRQRAGVKMPRGLGWVSDPRRAAYNRVYARTTRGCGTTAGLLIVAIAVATAIMRA